MRIGRWRGPFLPHPRLRSAAGRRTSLDADSAGSAGLRYGLGKTTAEPYATGLDTLAILEVGSRAKACPKNDRFALGPSQR